MLRNQIRAILFGKNAEKKTNQLLPDISFGVMDVRAELSKWLLTIVYLENGEKQMNTLSI